MPFRTKSHPLLRTTLSLGLLLAWASSALPQLQPVIRPARSGDQLVAHVTIHDIFSEKILGTIQSGLPAVIDLYLRLEDDRGKRISQVRVSREVRFRVWEAVYEMRQGGNTAVIDSLEELTRRCGNVNGARMTGLRLLDRTRRYRLKLRVEVTPISRKQSQRIRDWVMESEETEEALPSEGRSGGFFINLNKLIGVFLGSPGKKGQGSQWYISPEFTTNDLSP